MRIQKNAIKKKVKAMFYEEFGDDIENNEDVLKKVSALYYVSYAKSSTEDGSIPIQTRSLPWIFLDRLVDIKKKFKEDLENESKNVNKKSRFTSLADKLSVEMNEAANKLDAEMVVKCKTK